MLDRAKRTEGTPLPYVRNINVRWGTVDLSDLLTMPFKDSELERFALRGGDVLVCEGGEPGRAAVWHHGEGSGIKYQKAIHRVRLGGGIEPQWLVYSLWHDAERGVLDRRFTGTTIKHFTREAICQYGLLIPPLPEQQRIIAALEEQFSKLDATVGGLRRAQANLKRYRASVLKAAVEGRLVPTEAQLAREQGRDYEPAEALLRRILAERRSYWEAAEFERLKAKGKPPSDDRWKRRYQEPITPDFTGHSSLPEGWCWATIDQLAFDVRYGSSAKASPDADGIPVLRMGNIVDGTLNFADLKYLPNDHHEFPDLLLEPGDLLFNRTNSAELVGKSAVFRGYPSSCSIASYLIRVRLMREIAPEFVAFFINSLHGRSWIAAVVSQQVGQANVNGTKLKSCALPLPPVTEQERIVAEVDRHLSLVDRVLSASVDGAERCDALRKSILCMAFEGKLVAQSPSDEPASVLLERIRSEREVAERLQARQTHNPRSAPRGRDARQRRREP
jgi:type I restriction enzyme S subunit